MNIIYRCNNCGWFNETHFVRNNLSCPKCNNKLITDIYNEEDNEITKLIEEDELEFMKWEITQDGNNNKWHDIETIKNPHTRAEERKLFIKAGGVIPRNFEIKT